MVRDFKIDHSFQHRLEAGVVCGRERSADERVELVEHALDDWLEGTRPRCQLDERRPSVGGVRRSTNEAVALQQAHHRGHRLLAEHGSGGELAHAQTVLLEEGNEQRPVRRPHVGVALAGEALGQQPVPALGGLGEQEPEVVASRGHQIGTTSDEFRAA
jgi:hypothetical protein